MGEKRGKKKLEENRIRRDIAKLIIRVRGEKWRKLASQAIGLEHRILNVPFKNGYLNRGRL